MDPWTPLGTSVTQTPWFVPLSKFIATPLSPVCIYVYQTITLKQEVNSYICTSGVSPVNMVKFAYEGHRVKVKVTGTKKSKCLFPQCKTLIGHNFGSIQIEA